MNVTSLTRRTALSLLAAPFLVRPAAASVAVLIFAAASLRQGLEAALAIWDGAPVAVSYAGTATLARQIEAGAPADLFFAANMAWVEHLSDGDALDGTPVPVLGNQLVLAGAAPLISPTSFDAALAALPANARIATGFTEAVPVGIYTRQALTALGLWETYAPRLVQTENTRIAATLAARQDVARAIIYATDVAADPLIATEAVVAPHLHDPITYPLALCARGTHPDRAALAGHLTSDASLAVFMSHGFTGAP